MGKVILEMAMSLDGYIAGPNDEVDGLHDWLFSTPKDDTDGDITARHRSLDQCGAIIMGRRAYDLGDEVDGFAESPYTVPHFVLTHQAPTRTARASHPIVFVTDGIYSALRQAQAIAGARDVVIGGGACIAQQYLKAGLIEEYQIHLVPMLLGDGVCLFDPLETAYARLHHKAVIAGAGAVHLTLSM